MGLVSLTPTPAAGFDMPLAILSGCHERILRFCDMLERLLAHIETAGVDLQAEQTAVLILRYFSTAGQHHHEDEEQDLFPLLLSHEPAVATLLQQLAADHRQLDTHWAELATMLNTLHSCPLASLRPVVTGFVQAQRQHLQQENRELLPRAATLLTLQEHQALGQAMARRRGVDYASGPARPVA